MSKKPHAPATVRNREPILAILKTYIRDQPQNIFELGSGTGEHGVFFANALPHCTWHLSDRPENLPGIRQHKEASLLGNLEGPYELEIGVSKRPSVSMDLIFTANTFHIMSMEVVEKSIDILGGALRKDQRFLVYGPFNYNGKFSSPSNEAFDQQLKSQDPAMGIRSFEDIDFAMQRNGLFLVEDHIMPANNQLLVFQKG